jgi:hypothetical protein
MELKQANRKQVKIKMLVAGASGTGKTYSALLLANGITEWNKIAVIDTENGSADLYSHLGDYNTLTIEAPFTPEKYIDAINLCIKSGMEVIIIDSITHEWDGAGGILEVHGAMTGNSYTNWNKVTPRHNKFINTILQSPVHIISTVRTKQDYVLQEKNGKQVPEKVGLKSITRDGFDYENTLVLDLDIKHYATSSKDRTKLFDGEPAFMISQETGMKILKWCEDGLSPVNEKDFNFILFSAAITASKDEKSLRTSFDQIYRNKDKFPKEDYEKLVALKDKQKIDLGLATPDEIYTAFIAKLKDAFLIDQLKKDYEEIKSSNGFKLLSAEQVKSIERNYEVIRKKFENSK